jgi:hypothetical protein
MNRLPPTKPVPFDAPGLKLAALIAVIALVVFLIQALAARAGAPRESAGLRLTGKDVITTHQLYEGTLITGSTGSGKSSGPGDTLARHFLRERAGMLVLCAKPTEFAYWSKICAEEGRSADLVRFAPGSGVTCDLLHAALAHPEATVADAEALLSQLMEVDARSSEGRGDEAYWRVSSSKCLRYAVQAVHSARGRASLSEVYQFLVSAPTSPAQVADPAWKGGSYAAAVLHEAGTKNPGDHDTGLMLDYWLSEWPSLSDKTRSIIYSMATNLLDKFTSGPVAGMVSSGETNLPPEAVFGDGEGPGKVVVLDMPTLTWGAPGGFFQITYKTLVQKAALRRDVSKSPRPLIVWQDECQQFLTEFDVQVQALARASRVAQVSITQSLPVLYGALGGGPKAEQQAKALIGNCQTKFLGQQSDKDTNDYFSAMLGQSLHLLMGGGTQSGGTDVVGELLGTARPQANASYSENLQNDYPPENFTRLRKGGPPDYTVDCVVYQGGRRFSNGRTWLPVSFQQRR